MPSSCTLLLVSCQWLPAISHLMLFSWVNSARPQPFMDSYYAHYKAKRRYWPGLLLVLCFVLLMFALNPQQHSRVNRQLEFFNCGPGSGVGFTGLNALGRFLCSELDHPTCCHLPLCQSVKRKSACSLLHFYLHSTCKIKKQQKQSQKIF